MAEILGAVVAADINDDGKIELVTTDTHGNIAAWTAEGKEIWEQHLKSLVTQVCCSINFSNINLCWNDLYFKLVLMQLYGSDSCSVCQLICRQSIAYLILIYCNYPL